MKILCMKKLFVFPLSLFGFLSFAQPSGLINKDQLSVPVSRDARQEERLTIKRIALKTGVELEYAEQGNAGGVPVIFLHGVTDSWHSFETTLPHLPPSVHAFAISQRGHGNSERPEDVYTPVLFAADLAAFIEQKDLGAVVIVGHSMGGIIAQQFVLNYPQLTSALVIVGSDPAISKNPGIAEFKQEVLKMEGEPNREFMVAFQNGTLSKPIDSSYFNLLVNESMKVPVAVFKAALKGFADVDYTPLLDKVTHPALIFWGDKDMIFQREGQERLTSLLRNSKWLVYKGTGHALHWEEPKRFANDLTEFIEKNVAITK